MLIFNHNEYLSAVDGGKNSPTSSKALNSQDLLVSEVFLAKYKPKRSATVVQTADSINQDEGRIALQHSWHWIVLHMWPGSNCRPVRVPEMVSMHISTSELDSISRKLADVW